MRACPHCRGTEFSNDTDDGLVFEHCDGCGAVLVSEYRMGGAEDVFVGFRDATGDEIAEARRMHG